MPNISPRLCFFRPDFAPGSKANIIFISAWHRTIWDLRVFSFFPATFYPKRENHLERAGIEPRFSFSTSNYSFSDSSVSVKHLAWAFKSELGLVPLLCLSSTDLMSYHISCWKQNLWLSPPIRSGLNEIIFWPRAFLEISYLPSPETSTESLCLSSAKTVTDRPARVTTLSLGVLKTVLLLLISNY